MNEITVQIKNVYGNECIYPISEAAQLFAQLAKHKTFTASDIKLIKLLGYEVKVVQPIERL